MAKALKEERAEAIRLYGDGFQPAKIAASVGVSLASVVSWLRQAGIYKERRRPSEVMASALAMYADGVFITEIARRTGCGTTTIFRWAERAGIVQPFGDRIIDRFINRPAGREHIGKKGLFHSQKSNAWIPTDSNYELARLEQLEADAGVVKFERCKDRILYHHAGKLRRYNPDFRVVLSSGAIVIEEVKPERFLSDSKTTAKLQAGAAYYLGLGIQYRIVTEKTIGEDALKSFQPSGLSRQTVEYQEEKASDRRVRHAAAERVRRAAKKMVMTDEQLEARRTYVRAKMREYRARKKA